MSKWALDFAKLKEVVLAFVPLGFITFGGPQAHIAVLQQNFVEKRQWLSADEFTELFGLASALPGPSSSQMVAAIGFIHAGYFGGILSLLIFQLPGFVVMSAAGLGSANESVAQFLTSPPNWFVGLKEGLFAAAIGLITVAVYKLGTKATATKFTQAIMTITTILTILVRAPWSLPLYLAGSGLVSFLALTWWPSAFPNDVSKPPPQKDREEQSPPSLPQDEVRVEGNDENSVPLEDVETPPTNPPPPSAVNQIIKDYKWGIIFIVSTVLILIGLIIARNLVDSVLVTIAETFYRCGALIYGGGQVVLPMLVTEMVDPGYISETMFLYGLALVQVLPGPLFNFSAFLGGSIAGVPGMIISWCCIFAPGTMLILGVHPFWDRLSKQLWMKKVLIGVNSGALGLIVAGFFILFVKVPLRFVSCAVLGFSLTFFYDLNTPLVILLSGILGLGINTAFPA